MWGASKFITPVKRKVKLNWGGGPKKKCDKLDDG